MRTPLAVGFSPSPVSTGAALCRPQSASDKRRHGGARTRLTSFFRPAFITRHLVPLLRAQINPGRTEGRQPVYRATDACSKGPAWNCPARRQEVPGKGREAPRVPTGAKPPRVRRGPRRRRHGAQRRPSRTLQAVREGLPTQVSAASAQGPTCYFSAPALWGAPWGLEPGGLGLPTPALTQLRSRGRNSRRARRGGGFLGRTHLAMPVRGAHF